jgi:signal transduction histidine kinase
MRAPGWAERLVTGSRDPAWLWWGAEATTFLNDACASLVGPAAHELSRDELSGEPWAMLRSLSPDAREVCLVIDRGDGPEEAYFAFASIRFPAAYDGGGVFCTLTETTAAVLERRRSEVLYGLARNTAASRTVEGACRSAVEALATNTADLPLVVIYRVDEANRTARLVVAVGTEGTRAAPEMISLAEPPTGWPLIRVFESHRGEIVLDLDRLGIPAGPDRPNRAVALPVIVDGRVVAFLCIAIERLRRLDPELRSYLDLAVREIGAAIANGRAHQSTVHTTELLGELDRKKTDFFFGVTHEFRTPLTLLSSAIEDALIEAKDTMLRDRMQMAHRNAQRLHKLVNTLLDFARIEANQVGASFAPTNLAQLTKALASSFATVCEQVGIKLVIDCPPLSEPVHVDPQMWEKIVLNLVSNAFKFTFVGTIEVALRERDEVVELVVTDSGNGISAEHLPRLFERFFRIHGVRARSAEGTGIGLTIVRELARWHGGDVTVDSAPGRGSRFGVTVRRGTAHLPADQLDGSHSLISRATRSAFTEEAKQWTADELADRVPAGPLGVRPRILWADDNGDMRAYVRQLLATEFEVVAVTNGHAALDAFRSKPFDLVLADVMMPGMDGLALVEALRAEPPHRAVPILLLSGRTGDEAAIEALERGADEYLVKPLANRRLLATIRSHLSLARLRRAAE